VSVSQRILPVVTAAVLSIAGVSIVNAETESGSISKPLTVGQARTLPISELAKLLLGEQLGPTVIEAVRHEYEGSDPTIPDYVEFYTQPVLTDPRLNGICRTDVVTVEYNWPDVDPQAVHPSTPLMMTHFEAVPRYKSFPMPVGEPGTPDNDAAQAAACAQMKTAVDAFRAPSAGDAQWLAAIEREYTNPKPRFAFTCTDLADRSCRQARRNLQELRLTLAGKAELVDCQHKKTGDQIDRCDRLSFPRAGEKCSDRQDLSGFECSDLEWVLTVFAGMKTGDSPVRILSLHLEHEPKPIAIS